MNENKHIKTEDISVAVTNFSLSRRDFIRPKANNQNSSRDGMLKNHVENTSHATVPLTDKPGFGSIL
jgi:hypothetical protein